MRPADEVEVAAHRILAGEPVLPEAIVHGPEQRFADERTADPLTAPATPRPYSQPSRLLPCRVSAPLRTDAGAANAWKEQTQR